MKVVILHPPLYPMNHEFYNLLGQEIDLTVYSIGEYPLMHKDWQSYDFQKDAKNYTLKCFGKKHQRLINQLSFKAFTHLIKEKADIVISVAFWLPSFYASYLKRVLGYKMLIMTDVIENTERNVSTYKKWIRKKILANTDRVIAASSLTKKYIGLLDNNVLMTESLQTINIREWRRKFNLISDNRVIRDQLGIDYGVDILLGIGNLTDKKNWEKVFDIVSSIDNCFFILVGDGENKDRYHNYLKSRKLGNKVLMINSVKRDILMQYFKISDALIFPSLYDQYGYVVVEALCSSLPVICSKYTGASTLIKNGYNGYIIDPYADFSDEIKLMIERKNLMKKNAYQSISKLSLERKVDEYMNIFKMLG